MPLIRLGWTFLRVGAVAFGGLGATVALIESELVQRQRVTIKEDITHLMSCRDRPILLADSKRTPDTSGWDGSQLCEKKGGGGA